MKKQVKKTNKIIAKVVPVKPVVKKDVTTIRSKLADFDNKNLESKSKVVSKQVPTKLAPVKKESKVEIKVTFPPMNKKEVKCLNVYTGSLVANKKPDAVKCVFSDVLLKKIKVKADVFEKMIRSDKSSVEVANQAGLAPRTIRRLRQNLKK